VNFVVFEIRHRQDAEQYGKAMEWITKIKLKILPSAFIFFATEKKSQINQRQ